MLTLIMNSEDLAIEPYPLNLLCMTGDFQGTAQMNYCDENIPYTRIIEHKHFTPWETHEKTIYF